MTEEQKKKCTELWIEYKPYMLNVCRAKLHGCESEIDDIIGELHLAFCNQIVKKGFPEKTKAWLFSTLENKINEFFRHKYKREENIIDVDTTMIELPYQPDFVETIENNERLDAIEEIIPTLKPDEQLIIHETYFSEYKIKMREIAKELGISEAAAKQKRYRVCRKMQQKLKKF